jgi:AraC-like DNA-binding protein
MNKSKSSHNLDLDIKIPIGNMTINILAISYEAPRPSWGYKNHSHSSYELHFIPEGRGILRVFQTDYNIDAGTFYLTGPDVFHEQKADDENPMGEYSINFEIKVSKSHNTKNDTFIQSEVDNILEILKNTNFWFGADEFSTIEVFEKIFYEFENNLIGYYTYVQSLALQIILNAVRSLSSKRKSSYFVPRKILNDSRRLLVDDYFRNYDKELSPEELSHLIGVTERQLNRIMQEYYSMTFKEKLTKTRLEEAKNLLLTTGLPIKDIAEQTGFSCLSYFSRVFSKYYKVSPSDFREMK